MLDAVGRRALQGPTRSREAAPVGRSSSKADRAGRALQRGERRRPVAGRTGRRPDPVGAEEREGRRSDACGRRGAGRGKAARFRISEVGAAFRNAMVGRIFLRLRSK